MFLTARHFGGFSSGKERSCEFVGQAHTLDGVDAVSGTVKEVTPQTINWNRSTINGRAALSTVDSVASILGRYGLVIVIGWWPTARSWALQHLSRLHVLRAFGCLRTGRRGTDRAQANRAKAFHRGRRVGGRAFRLDDQLPVHDSRFPDSARKPSKASPRRRSSPLPSRRSRRRWPGRCPPARRRTACRCAGSARRHARARP